MNVLIIGTNSLSHCLAELLAADPVVEKIYHPEFNMPVSNNSFKYFPVSFRTSFLTTAKSLEEFILTTDIDLIIPTEHRYQLFTKLQAIIKLKKIPVLMPSQQIGMLEWSKIAGKKFLEELNIPTAPYKVFSANELFDEFFNISRPFVLKYDQDWRAGLQTVIITDQNVHEQFEYLKKDGLVNYLGINRYTDEQYFIVENFISGVKEYSYHVLSNSTGWTYMGSARDYKKRFENDIGHNTASCGSYATVDEVDSRIENYVDSILNKLKEQGTPYIGVLYLGIIIDQNNNPVVLEINTRPGDPEFNSICPLINESLAVLFYKCATNKPLTPILFHNKKSVSIRIINTKYLLSYLCSREINPPVLLPPPTDLMVHYNSHRGLLYCVITATASTIHEASNQIYKFLKNKDMGNYTYRTDIGHFL